MTDLILFNANIITLDPKSPGGQLVAIENGRISAVTGNDRLRELKNRHTQVIDCKGKAILPGFIDAHCHLHAFGESLMTFNLAPVNHVHSISDIKSSIRKLSQSLPAGTWIRARGYHEYDLSEKRHPTRKDLDEAASTHPIKITHRSGHAHVLNSLALELVGISKKTSDPPGGLIDRDLVTGEPTGRLYEMGEYLSKRIPPLDMQELHSGVEMANQKLLSLGITSIQDASSRNDVERWKRFRYWKENGLLKPRVNMMLGAERVRDYRSESFTNVVGESQLRIHGVKIILDETTGQLHPPQSELTEMVFGIHKLGLQVAIHAIEERAVESACSAIQYALSRFPRQDHRHRIEHCSVCPPALAKRLASLAISVVTQPGFIYFNGDRYLSTVSGEQLRHLYPIGTLMRNGAEVVGSSDCPMAPANPLIGIYSAVTRMSETSKLVSPEESISPLEALRMYTDCAARASFEESIKGSIMVGKLADLVVLNDDPTSVPVNEIKDLKVEMTILNGEVVWEEKREEVHDDSCKG